MPPILATDIRERAARRWGELYRLPEAKAKGTRGNITGKTGGKGNARGKSNATTGGRSEVPPRGHAHPQGYGRNQGECEQLTNAANHSAVFSAVLRSDLCRLVPFRSHIWAGGAGRHMQETPIFQGFYGRGAGI
jgi:hypothetical protein